LIANGKPFRGFNGNAGEFGGIWTVCGTGYPNLDLLKNLVAEAGLQFDTVEAMVQAIGSTTSGVDAWIDRAAPAFSLLCSVLAYTVDPQTIVIGGRLPTSIGKSLVARIAIPQAAHRRGWSPPVPQIVVAESPSDPVAFGAAAMPFTKAFFG
jgi:predicted NBD/HSP70 family sugar kinase